MSAAKFLTVLMVSTVVASLVGESMADYDDCYSKCKFDCLNHLELPNFICKIRCTLDCIVPFETAKNDGLHFCNLGCASLLCGNLINDQNPSNPLSEGRAVGCLDSCSAVCTKNYIA